MMTMTEITRYADAWELGMTVEELVEFFRDCQKSASEDKAFTAYTEEDLRELAEKVISYREALEETEEVQNSRYHDYIVYLTDSKTGATSPIDNITTDAGYTADQYVKECEENADPEWIELLHSGEVTMEEVF